MALIGAVTVVPLALLVWLGWRVLEQDRILERQQARDRLERAGDLVAAALERAIVSSEQRLAAGAQDWAEGAVAVVIQDERIEAYPDKRLAFLPKAAALREAPAETFAEGEALEFRTGNRAAAIDVYRALTKSSDTAIRAGALLRLARNLSATGQIADAFAVYAGMASLDGVAISGAPASLVARYARCQLLERANRESELRAEAQTFAGELASGRWSLTPPLYWLYVADVTRWGAAPFGKREAEQLAEAATRVWGDRMSLSSRGRQMVSVDDQAMVVLWQKSDRALLALIAGPAFVESQWINAARSVATEQRVSFALANHADRADSNAVSTVRTSKQTELPWDLAVTSNGPGEQSGQFAVRRRLLVAGLTVMVAMAFVTGLLIVRAVKRELAVAQLQSDFVAAVSHEFRTPLTTLRQFTDMLRKHEREGPDAGKERRMLCYDAQSRATERLTKLVESLLDFGRTQAGAQSYQLEPCDCTSLVRHVVEEFRATASSSGYDVQFSGNGSAPIHADSDALGRAIWNLLENAVKYSPDRRQIDVGVHREGDAMRIAVHDDGIGIPPHEQRQIFAKFKRGEEARNRGITGTGIGLAMVDEIVKAHRGHMEVKSAVGAGSTFTIVLPVVGEAG
jgi:signal transduction histidine kinase